jgi:hypothetical protein
MSNTAIIKGLAERIEREAFAGHGINQTQNRALKALKLARTLLVDIEGYEPSGPSIQALDRVITEASCVALPVASAAPDNARRVIGLCQKALAEELSAWDIDPPLHHVKEAHEECSAWLSTQQTQSDGMQPIDVLTSVWNAMQNSADGDDLLSKLEHMRDSICRAIAAAPQQAPQAGDTAESVNETNAVLASRYFDLLKVVEAYEKHGVTCQTFRHFIDAPCAECNSRQAPQAAQPMAYLWVDPVTRNYEVDHCTHPIDEVTPVYAAPQSAPIARPLSDEQLDAITPAPETFGAYQAPWTDYDKEILSAAMRSVERAHGIKGD